MFEHKQSSLLPFSLYLRRVVKHFLYTLLLIGIAVLIGMVGYHYSAELEWIDAFYNASMILTGMGPVTELTSVSAKLFSSFYALFSGIVFLTTVAVFFAPIAHRILHKFHIEDENQA